MVTSGLILCNRYLVQNELGVGGMGAVYEATDLRTGAQVAVKVLHPLYARNPQYISRLRREAQIAASIRTPRAVRVIDLDDHDGMPFLVMEYVAGETLSERLERDGALPPEVAITVCIEITRALEGGHAVGVVHRDLKPQNVKITDEGEIKVLDFGIARAENLPGITGTNMFTGTPEYCAPERMDSQGDIRSDIYSVGVMLYEMLAGQRPFDGPNPFAILRQHETAPVPPLSRPPLPEVQKVLDRTLAKRPEDRYQTPSELTAGLRAARDALFAADPEARRVSTTMIGSAGVKPSDTSESTRELEELGPPPVFTAGGPGSATIAAPAASPAPTPAVARARAGQRGKGLLLTLVGGGAAALAAIVLAAVVFSRGGPPGEPDEPSPPARVSGVDATATSPAVSSRPTPVPLLQAGEKITLDVRDEVDLPICLDRNNRPQVKSVLRITAVERDPRERGRVVVSFTRSVPRVSGVECPLKYDPDAVGDVIALETFDPVESRTVRAPSIDGTGIAVTGAPNIYGREDVAGSWVFNRVELNGSELVLVQRLTDGRDLHRLKLLPR